MKDNKNVSPFAFPEESKALNLLRKRFDNRPMAGWLTLSVNFPDSWKDAVRNHFAVTAELTIHSVERILKTLSKTDMQRAKAILEELRAQKGKEGGVE